MIYQIRRVICFFSLLCIFNLTSANAATNSISVYPDKEITLPIEKGLTVTSFSASPKEAMVAYIYNKKDVSEFAFWDLNSNKTNIYQVAKNIKLQEILWHPLEDSIFMLGRAGDGNYVIMRADKKNTWKAEEIFKSKDEIRNLVISPRPFGIDGKDEKKPGSKHRLYFAVKKDKNFAIDTISEAGTSRYQVVGQNKVNNLEKNDSSSEDDAYVQEHAGDANIIKGDAFPIAFHPAGKIMLVKDEKECFSYVEYGGDNWAEGIHPLYKPQSCHGSVSFLSNGLGTVHWHSGQKGVELLIYNGNTKKTLLENTSFVASPHVSPDDSGIIGLVQDKLVYTPVAIPLANVANAWMFTENEADRQLLEKNSGILRPGTGNQLYNIYDSELYKCGDYDDSTPTRPYIVTTDIFWETYAAAYEGLFILIEKKQAVPAFWEFVEKAASNNKLDAKWQKVFKTLVAVKNGKSDGKDTDIDKELVNINNAAGTAKSNITGAQIAFDDLKPRGHYDVNAETKNYFKAFKYLQLILKEPKEMGIKQLDINQLDSLPKEVKSSAITWIKSYLPFIAPPRGDVIWDKTLVKKADLAEAPNPPMIFPLSWGIDNEVFYRAIFHSASPPEKQITGPGGPRMLPSSLDIATVLGSSLAKKILEDSGEFSKYPNLKPVLENLQKQYGGIKNASPTLYEQWMDALAVQWADNPQVPAGVEGLGLYNAKRLQTGLASWATLRHATVLVNERTSAECGEGGFEPLILEFPKGFVESDPKTLEAIAQLFDNLSKYLSSVSLEEQKNIAESNGAGESMLVDNHDKSGKTTGVKSLKDSILQHLAETAGKIRYFKSMAEKQLKGQELTAQEYEDIFYIGRVAEYNFLIFKSLAKDDLAISNPDEIAKIADVAGETGNLLYAAVGNPLEWDFIYPVGGKRKMIGKGPVYSFYEFTDSKVLNDKDWREMVANKSPTLPKWIMPYMSNQNLSCPAKNPL
jgi:hypothetical protein